MTIKAADFERIVRKLDLKTRDSGDRLAWFEHKGKVITRTRRSKKKGTDLPFQHSIRQQLKLNEDQLRGLIDCTVGRDDYVEILRAKGLI